MSEERDAGNLFVTGRGGDLRYHIARIIAGSWYL